MDFAASTGHVFKHYAMPNGATRLVRDDGFGSTSQEWAEYQAWRAAMDTETSRRWYFERLPHEDYLRFEEHRIAGFQLA